MIGELDELSRILNQAKHPERTQELIETTIQALLYHQIIYSDTQGISKDAFKILQVENDFFNKLFSACGFKLEYNSKYEMFSLLPKGEKSLQYASNIRNLKKDETLFRLALRYILETHDQKNELNEVGRVDTTTDEIMEVFTNICKQPTLSEKRLMDDFLRPLHKRGAVRIRERNPDTKTTRVSILPGIRVLVPSELIEKLIGWKDQDTDKDFFSNKDEEVNV